MAPGCPCKWDSVPGINTFTKVGRNDLLYGAIEAGDTYKVSFGVLGNIGDILRN